MSTSWKNKSSTDDIRKRFDAYVDRFSNLDTGQVSTIDAPLAMELIAQAAFKSSSQISRVLDIGCGAGNNTLKLLELSGSFDIDLVDLSLPMLEKAKQRIEKVNQGNIRTFQKDFREIDLTKESYDVILAAAVLHHLRDDADWESTFKKIYDLTSPGGSVWITDLIAHESNAIQSMMWQRYGKYLTDHGGEEYKNAVFDYIEIEDSPRSLIYQLDLLRKSGFKQVEILHKNSCFAAFGAIK